MKPSIYSLTRQGMQEWVLEQGEKKFRADQIWEWLYRKRVQSFEEMTNLSKDLIAKLNEQLRLRGFYKNERAEESLEKISRLQDYLLEYCSYGCAYFVLENEVPKRAPFDQKMRKKEEEKDSRKGKKTSQSKKKNHTDKRNRRRSKDQKSQKEDKVQRHFVIRKKD